MYPDNQNQQNPPPQNQTPQPMNNSNTFNEQPSPQQGYEWLANYPGPDSTAQLQPSKTKKKLVFGLLIFFLLTGFSVAAILLSNQNSNHEGIVDNPEQEQSQKIQQDDNENSDDVDKQRKDKLNTIQKKLEVYYAMNNHYPTFDEATNEAWLDEKDIKKSEITDPESKDWKAKNIPTKNAFSYQPTPTNCDNQETICSGYKITAVLSDVSFYELKNNKH